MSTWLVTDIHDWSVVDADQPHPVFSVQQTPSVSDLQITVHDDKTHCSVCSYDHGGHTGQTLAVAFFSAAFIPAQNLTHSLHPDFWFSRHTSPQLRPPIA